MIKKVVPTAMYELVVDQLRRAIYIGTYLPGDKLPPERDLAVLLGVSRTTVREAVRKLEGEGLLRSQRGATGGVTVLALAETEEERLAIVRTQSAEFDQILDFRLAVEPMAARLAARLRAPTDLKRLDSAFAAMSTIVASAENRRRVAEFLRADTEFHLAIAAAAGNGWLARAVEDARAGLFIPVGVCFPEIDPEANEHHEPILTAIRQRNPGQAEASMIEHIEHTRAALKRLTRRTRQPVAR